MQDFDALYRQHKMPHTSYLKDVYNVNAYSEMICRSVQKISAFREKTPFDAIAFTGTSGAAVAYPLSAMMQIPLICVRKTVAESHHRHLLEGHIGCDRYIIVDDCIDTGATLERMQEAIAQYSSSKLVGIYMYHPHGYPGDCGERHHQEHLFIH